jgi:integrase
VLAFVVIGLETAMRRSEILSIRREHVDLARLTLFIPKAKAGSREQPFTRRLAEFLRAYLATLAPDEQWLFPSPASATGHATDIRKGFRRAVTAAGLDPDQIVRHTLRHTAITHLVQAGVDLPTVKRISGHKTLIMVERYAHANGAHIRTAMDKLEERYRKAS